MVKTAYLRAFEPIECFSVDEQRAWTQSSKVAQRAHEGMCHRWLVSAALPPALDLLGGGDGAFVRRSGKRILACPWRTRIRMLAGIVAFRSSVPEVVADAFVPAQQAERAARELAAVTDRAPEVRSHILHANWHVPLRWFTAFADSQRILTEDRTGLHVRYESPLGEAKARLGGALEVLEANNLDGVMVEAVGELAAWLEDFSDDGLLELDYATVAAAFEADDLADDRSAAEVWSCLEALSQGEMDQAAAIFSEVADRWTEARALEVMN